MAPANMDDFFEDIFGFRPSKRGRGFEMLVAAALKVTGYGNRVQTDRFLKGEYSGSTYQIDALVEADERVFVEAKDYTESAAAVGRGDVQKLSGALQDLSIERGMLASATGFTAPTKQYARATETGGSFKPIELVHIRPALEVDEKSRIRKITLRLSIHVARFEDAVWKPRFSAASERMLKSKLPKLQVAISEFYRPDGSVYQTIRSFTEELNRLGGWKTGTLVGEHVFPAGTCLRVCDLLVPIEALGYEVDFDETTELITIQSQGQARMVVRFESGEVNTLITDEQLKGVRFTDDGDVLLDDEHDGMIVTRSPG